MKISKLTPTEKHTLSLINKERVENKKTPIKWDKMPEQEVMVHLYGWDNKHVSIDKLLTPKEKLILINSGYNIDETLKTKVNLLVKTRRIRKKGYKLS